MVVTGTGKVLAEHDRYPAEVIREGLRAWDELPEAEKRPRRVSGVPRVSAFPKPPEPPPGAIILRAHIRALERHPDGNLTWTGPIAVAANDYNFAPEPQLDHVWITEQEWKSLIPTDPRVGDVLQIRPALAQRIAKFHLIDKALGCGVFLWEKARADLRLKVVSVTESSIEMDLHGQAWIGKNGDYPVRLQGFLTVDRRLGEFTRFDMLALGKDDGDFRTPAERVQRNSFWYRISPQSKVVMAIAFELTPGTKPIDLVPPYALMFDSEKNYGQPYFDPK